MYSDHRSVYRSVPAFILLALAPLALSLSLATSALAEDFNQPFVFSDAFFRSHGVEPERVLGLPTFKDPRNGVIRPDATLVSVPVHPDIDQAFFCLQSTGDWCD